MTHRSGTGTQCPRQWEGSEPTTALSADYRGLQRAEAGCEQLHTLFPKKALDTTKESDTQRGHMLPTSAVLCELRLVCGTGG